jgi:hypothetical protein
MFLCSRAFGIVSNHFVAVIRQLHLTCARHPIWRAKLDKTHHLVALLLLKLCKTAETKHFIGIHLKTLVQYIMYVYVRGRDSESLLRSTTATPTKPIYGPISDSPEQPLLCEKVSLLIPFEPLLRSETEFEEIGQGDMCTRSSDFSSRNPKTSMWAWVSA